MHADTSFRVSDSVCQLVQSETLTPAICQMTFGNTAVVTFHAPSQSLPEVCMLCPTYSERYKLCQ